MLGSYLRASSCAGAILGIASALLLFAACQSKNPEQGNGGEASAPATQETPEQAESPAEEKPANATEAPNFKVNGEKLPQIELGDDTTLLNLKSLPPIDEWKLLVVRNVEGREFRATKPSVLTGEMTMKVVRLADKTYEFRVMQKSGASENIRHRMPRVKVIEIHKQGYTPPKRGKRGKATALPITLKGKPGTLDVAALALISKTPEPGGNKNRDTWQLLDLLGTKSLAPEESVRLRAGDGEELVLKASDFADQSKMHIVKKSRRGEFHYREWSLGDSPTKSGGLRGLQSLELR